MPGVSRAWMNNYMPRHSMIWETHYIAQVYFVRCNYPLHTTTSTTTSSAQIIKSFNQWVTGHGEIGTIYSYSHTSGIKRSHTWQQWIQKKNNKKCTCALAVIPCLTLFPYHENMAENHQLIQDDSYNILEGYQVVWWGLSPHNLL